MYKNLYIKMTNNCHKKHKENLRQKSPERFQNISEKENTEKRQKKSRDRYQNFTEKESASS